MSYLKWTYLRDFTETEIKVISLFAKKTINASVVSDSNNNPCWTIYSGFLVSQIAIIRGTIYAPLKDCLPQEITNVYIFALILKSILKTDLELKSSDLVFPNDIDFSRRGINVPDDWWRAVEILREEGFVVRWTSLHDEDQSVFEPLVQPPFEVL